MNLCSFKILDSQMELRWINGEGREKAVSDVSLIVSILHISVIIMQPILKCCIYTT